MARSSDNANELSFGRKVRVYSHSGALTFEASTTREGTPTISLDAAEALADMGYDWASKIQIQFTAKELPVVAAVMMGFAPFCEYGGHGEAKDKHFMLKHQRDKVFVRVWSSHGARAVPIEMPDAYYVSGLLLLQLRDAMPWLSGQEISTLLRATIGRTQKKHGA